MIPSLKLAARAALVEQPMEQKMIEPNVSEVKCPDVAKPACPVPPKSEAKDLEKSEAFGFAEAGASSVGFAETILPKRIA